MKHLQKLGYIAIGSVLTLTVVGSALAATGLISINVDPTIKIQVNGTEFKPKDANGKDVPVFSYNGTTYAPLRALGEAFGQKIGYDEGNNMATVGEVSAPAATPTPDTTIANDYSDWTADEEKAYQEFKGMWSVSIHSQGDNTLQIDGSSDNSAWISYTLTPKVDIDSESVYDVLQSNPKNIKRLATELNTQVISVGLRFCDKNGVLIWSTSYKTQIF